MGDTLNGSYDLIPAEELYDACRLMAEHIEHRGGLRWDFSKVLEMPVPDEFSRLVSSYAKSVFDSDSVWRGWKLPETTLIVPWIARLYPDAYYIYWVRDPRDSIIGKHLTDDLADFGVPYDRVDGEREMRAVSWKYQREIVAATPKPARWHQVRFEDFVLDQDATLGKLEKFLGLTLAQVEVQTDSVGRWKSDDGRHDFEMFRADLEELGYVKVVAGGE